MRFSEWPGFQGLRVVVLWILLVAVVSGWRYYWRLTRAVADEATVAPFSITVPLLVALGPPLLLAVGTIVLRRSRRS